MGRKIVVRQTKTALVDARREIVFRVFRFNAEFDVLPHYDDFALKVSRGEVLLDALNRIKAELDSSLSYRKSCRHGICGSCAIKVENQAVLACKANLFALADRYGEVLTLEPLNKRLAPRDLIANKSGFWENYRAVNPWLEAEIDESSPKENLIPPAINDRLNGADACVACGICFYSCPVVAENDRFLGPAALAKSYRFAADIRDQALGDRLRLANSDRIGIWNCVKCYQCHETCPKEVSPIDKIIKLHAISAENNANVDSIAFRHAKAFKTSIQKSGRLDEAANVIESAGLFGALRHIREAFSMLRRGKLPFGVKKIDKLDEVQKLVKSASAPQSPDKERR
ncbi:MAG: succinate dehydrogenase/fumarate reductase iron-sulfur subunit [Helicobacteraceae bacterium]|jgi:succinate dehydrogenase / fumarate reductase iron-sulfur subunit|nr:succinate dehydrogenase/fumarate reductase iron-sulfur subunit [Helicobacteraceae bacterium]